MDVAKISMMQSQFEVASTVNVEMMKKALDHVEQIGKDITEMVKPAAVSSGSVIDLRV